MSNKHRKLKRPKPKPTIEQFMRAQIARIKSVVPSMHVTIIARHPANPNAEIVFSDDNMDGVIETLQGRRDAVVASQAAKEAE